MKVVVINGSPRKSGNGSKFLKEISALLKEDTSIDVKLINLSEKDIRMCKGCQVCYERGEGFCPLKDDVDSIKNEILECDGVILYSPTYVVNMPGLMKNFIDRLSYLCHRPAFYRKTALIFTTTGSSGGSTALKCLRWPVVAWGLKIIKSFDIKMSEYNRNAGYKMSVDESIKRSVDIFIKQTKNVKDSYPGFIDLVGFNARKQNYLKSKNVYKYDVEHWKQKGWLDKNVNYYFPVNLGRFKRLLVEIFTSVLKVVM
jgi:multimeric flavodoxin WrbA